MSKSYFQKVANPGVFTPGDLISIDGKKVIVLNVKLSGIIVGDGWKYRVGRFFKRLLRQ